LSLRDPIVLLDDIREACNLIIKYKGNSSFDNFAADTRTVHAILYNFQVIGEAANRLSEDIRKKYHNIKWADIIAFRNIVVHEYFGIDLRIVYQIATINVPELLEKLKNIR